MNFFVPFIVTLCIALFTTPLMIKLANKLNIIDSPTTPTVTFGEDGVRKYQSPSPAESPKRQISSVSSSESPTSPLSPCAKEIEESLKEAQENTKKNAEESIKELTITLVGAVVLQDPSASSLLQRRSQSK